MVNVLKSIFQRLYPYGEFRTGKSVYLTFDDGPIPEVTPKVLEILKKYGVPATFFMVGENIDKYPEIYEQVVAAGHSVANHTYNHIKGWRYSKEDYLQNVEKCQKAILEHMPHKTTAPKTMLFRPPYGKATLCQRKALHKFGYRIILWDILTRDYNSHRTPEAMLRTIKCQTRPGSIINFHDSLKSNERMLAVLPQAIEWLIEQGYELKAL